MGGDGGVWQKRRGYFPLSIEIEIYFGFFIIFQYLFHFIYFIYNVINDVSDNIHLDCDGFIKNGKSGGCPAKRKRKYPLYQMEKCKNILTKRDSLKWYQSLSGTIFFSTLTKISSKLGLCHSNSKKFECFQIFKHSILYIKKNDG